MNDVLERNVERLLARAYVPVRVPDEARERLRTGFLAALERRLAAPATGAPDPAPGGAPAPRAGASAPPPPTVGRTPRRAHPGSLPSRGPARAPVQPPGRRPALRPRAVRAVVAALVLLLAGLALWRTLDPAAPRSDAPLAQVDGARWRPLAGAPAADAGTWIALDAPRLAWDGADAIELAAGSAPVDLRSGVGAPEDALAARLAARAVGRFSPAPEPGPAPRLAQLVEGALALHAGEPGWLLGDAEGGLWLGAGELRVGPREAAGLRLELLRGRAFTQGFEALPVGRVVHLSGGRLVRAADRGPDRVPAGSDGVDAGGPGGDPSASNPGGPDAGAGDDPDAAAAGPLATLAVTWSGPAAGDLRLWLRREVALPEVSEAHARPLPPTGGSVAGLEPGSYTVVLEPDGGAPVLREGVVLEADGTTRLDLAPVDAGSIRGHVLDGRTGAPLRGARVLVQEELPHRVLHAQGEDLLEPPRTSTVTDDLGAFRLERVSVGVRNLVVLHPDLAPGFSAELRVRAGEETDAGRIELRAGATLHGRVQHAPDSPSVGTEVIASRVPVDRVQRVMVYGGVLTDDRGEYRIEGLAPGAYVVLDLAPDAVGGPAGSLRQVELRDGEVRRVDFGGTTEGSLHGVLVDADGEPLPGHHVTMTADGGGPYRSVGTDGAGRFVFEEVPHGRHHLYVTWEGLFGSVVHLCEVEVDGVDREPLHLALPGGSLVFDLTAPDGAAVDDALVLLERWDPAREEWRFLARVEHGRDGRFEVRAVPTGRVRGTITTPSVEGGARLLAPFDVEGPGERVVELALQPAGSLLVEVRDPEGRPRAGHEVQLAREDGQVLLVPGLRTDAAGQVRLPCLPPGTWRVRVRAGQDWVFGQGVVTVGDACLVRVTLP